MGRQMVTQAQILHAVPGRMRVHLSGWSGTGADLLTARLRRLPGVRDVQASPLTGNVLLRFDPAVAEVPSLLALVQESAEHPCGPALLPLRAQEGGQAAGSASPETMAVASIADTASRSRAGSISAGRWMSLLPRVADLVARLLLADSPLGLLVCGYEAMRLLLHLAGARLLGSDGTLTARRLGGRTWSLQLQVVVRG